MAVRLGRPLPVVSVRPFGVAFSGWFVVRRFAPGWTQDESLEARLRLLPIAMRMVPMRCLQRRNAEPIVVRGRSTEVHVEVRAGIRARFPVAVMPFPFWSQKRRFRLREFEGESLCSMMVVMVMVMMAVVVMMARQWGSGQGSSRLPGIGWGRFRYDPKVSRIRF
jgi:hypothetical protein